MTAAACAICVFAVGCRALPQMPALLPRSISRRCAGISAPMPRISYGGFLATLTAWCEQQRIPYEGVPVGSIKRFITGKGNAGKDAVIEAVRSRGFHPKDDNEADAIAILLWAIETHGGVR